MGNSFELNLVWGQFESHSRKGHRPNYDCPRIHTSRPCQSFPSLSLSSLKIWRFMLPVPPFVISVSWSCCDSLIVGVITRSDLCHLEDALVEIWILYAFLDTPLYALCTRTADQQHKQCFFNLHWFVLYIRGDAGLNRFSRRWNACWHLLVGYLST